MATAAPTNDAKPGFSIGSAAGTLAGVTKAVCWTSFSYGRTAVASTLNLLPAAAPEVVKGIYDEKVVRALGGVGLPVADAALNEFSGLLPGGRPMYNIIKTGARSISRTYNGTTIVAKDKRDIDDKMTESMETKMKKMEVELKGLKEKMLLSEIMRPMGGNLMKHYHEPVDVITLLERNDLKCDKAFLDAISVPKINVEVCGDKPKG